MQSDAFIEDINDIKFEIRYEGQDAEKHQIDMSMLAESLDGFSRVYAVVGHFVATGQYARQLPALATRVHAYESEAKCYNVPAWLSMASSTGIFQGLAGAVLTLVVTHIYSRNSANREEMKHLRELFEKQLGFSNAVTEKMLVTIEKLTDGLQPAARKSVSPVGKTCDRIDLYEGGLRHQSIDLAAKELILADPETDLLPEREYAVKITEMDKVKKTCKVHFAEEDDAGGTDDDGSPVRVSGDITDPAIMLADNPYMAAFASGSPIKIKAKALVRDGLITKLFISDGYQ